ncbi:MAG: hypothetical protein V3W20_08370 [Candidatus Neomarinimicrobiota bacterium]|nr:hypothetical protein [Candidatus Neomarinimicrobiota bacterium]
MKIRFFLILIVLLYLFCFVVTCSEADTYEEVEVNIVSIITEARVAPYETDVKNIAVIQYTIKNTGTKTIYGWKVFFNVSLQRGPQLTTYDRIYYILEPGEISSTQIAEVLIPSYYEKATGAHLNHIETW